MSITYRTAFTELSVAEDLAKLVHNVLEVMIKQPRTHLQDIDLLESQASRLLWNRCRQVSRNIDRAEDVLNSSGTRRPPETKAETALLSLWGRVLNAPVELTGRDDNFFRLGGDSMRAMKLVSEGRKKGMALTVKEIFNNPTLAGMAATVRWTALRVQAQTIKPFSLLGSEADTKTVRELVADACGIATELVEDIYPCSSLQEGMVFLSSKRSGDFVMRSALELQNDIDEGCLRRAWEHVIRNSAILRTRIVHCSGVGLVQVVVRDPDLHWEHSLSLSEYLSLDCSTSMELSDCLTRQAIVVEDCRRWFVLSIHHALYDGWTLPRIAESFHRSYFGTPLEVGVGYNVFIQHVKKVRGESTSAEYWHAMLADYQGTPFPVPPLQTGAALADTSFEKRCLLSKAPSSVTVAVLVRATLALTLARYANTTDVLFGATISGRNADIPGIDAVQGPTIATVPVRIPFALKDSCRSFLGSVGQKASEMIPFEQTGLQEIAKVHPNAQRACKFRTLLVVQPREDELQDAISTLGTWRNCSKAQNFDTYELVIRCTLTGDGVKVAVNFDKRALPPWHVRNMLEQFSHFLTQLSAADEHMTLAGLDWLTPSDLSKLEQWNTSVPPSMEHCLHELLEAQTTRSSDALAVHAWDGDLTYSELSHWSDRLATHLMDFGVAPGIIVPLCFDKSRWMTVAIFGVLKAGAAFVPIDPIQPAARHHEIFGQTSARIVLSSKEQASRWSNLPDITIIVVGDQASTKWPNSKTPIAGHCRPNDKAYVMFTSGSTGVPKGAIIEHRAITTSSLMHGERLGFSESSRVLQFASYSFDVLIAETFTTIVHGGCLCVPSDEDRRERLTEVIKEMQCNLALLTPTVAKLLVPEDVPSLRTMILTGEPVDKGDVVRWQGHADIYNAYGPAECSVLSAIANYSDARPEISLDDSQHKGLIGTSVGCLCWVTEPEDSDRLAAIGAVGELLIEGPIVGRGYLKNQAKTDQAFISNPKWLASRGRSGRLYRTGDLVRYTEDGALLYMGRKDQQVKIRGQRVELGEIEYHIREHIPHLHLSVVECIEHIGPDRHPILAAFVESDGQGTSVLLSDEYEEILEDHLPSYMIPSFFIRVPSIPQTSNGKADRKRLRLIGSSQIESHLASTPKNCSRIAQTPTSATERLLQEIWFRVLGIAQLDRISIDDSFFSLGGDSITAMQVAASARHQHIRFSANEVLRLRTIRRLAQHADSSPSSDFPACSTSDVELYNLTAMQHMHLLRYCTDGVNPVHSIFVEVKQATSVDRFRNAFALLAERHAMLRARFVRDSSSGQWRQVISDPDSFDAVVPLRQRLVRKRDVVYQQLCYARPKLDPEHGPMATAQLFNCDDGAQFLFLSTCCLAIDHFSLRILVNELQSILYGESLPRRTPPSFLEWRKSDVQPALRQSNLDEGCDLASSDECSSHQESAASYWLAEKATLIKEYTAHESFELDNQVTTALLGPCNTKFRTRAEELMIAGLIHAYARTLPERSNPAVLNRSDGRRTCHGRGDFSQTVGCFTDEFRVDIPDAHSLTLSETIQEMKACIRRHDNGSIPPPACNTGRHGQISSSDEMIPVEIVFAFHNLDQSFERDRPLFEFQTLPVDAQANGGAGSPQQSLFSVSITLSRGKAKATLAYSEGYNHQHRIRYWFSRYRDILVQISETLPTADPQWTPLDFPLAFSTNEDVTQFQKETLPTLQVMPEEVEDIFPCTDMQKGILIGQSKDPSSYWVRQLAEIKPPPSEAFIDAAQLQMSWKVVVRRHQLLRALLVQQSAGSTLPLHVILKDPVPPMLFLQGNGESEEVTLDYLALHGAPTTIADERDLQHHLTVLQLPSGQVFVSLIMNHAIFDAYSQALLVRDLQQAYSDISSNATAVTSPRGGQNEPLLQPLSDKVPHTGLTARPTYRDVVYHQRKQDSEDARKFWRDHLRGVEPCHFPVTYMAQVAGVKSRHSVAEIVGIHSDRFLDACRLYEVAPAAIFRAAWALVLATFVDSADPCFGILASGRDLELDETDEIFGPMINMFVCRAPLDQSHTLKGLVQSMQSDHITSLQHQTFSMARIHQMLHVGPTGLFNTVVNVKKVPIQADEDDLFSIHDIESDSPQEV
jgi:amino acid adenylation domain-containing protein